MDTKFSRRFANKHYGCKGRALICSLAFNGCVYFSRLNN